MVSSKVDGRHARGIIARTYEQGGSMESTTETAPAGALTPNEGLTEPDRGSAMQQSIDRQRLAGDFLTRARDDFERAARTRVKYAIMARQYGLTNADIGTFLGVTEGAVRALIKRHGDA